MSRAAEEAYERYAAKRDIETARLMVVGAKVWRAGWDTIEEGVVRRVTRCNILDEFGSYRGEREDPNGKYPYYFAEFKDGSRGWESQTFECKFFSTISGAQKELVKCCLRRVDEHKREVAKWEELAAKTQAECDSNNNA